MAFPLVDYSACVNRLRVLKNCLNLSWYGSISNDSAVIVDGSMTDFWSLTTSGFVFGDMAGSITINLWAVWTGSRCCLPAPAYSLSSASATAAPFSVRCHSFLSRRRSATLATRGQRDMTLAHARRPVPLVCQ